MTVKELRKQLENFHDNDIVMIPNINWHPWSSQPADVEARNVLQGGGPYEICVFIDACEEVKL